jgi:putative SOS response-associated peptidase YedK
MCGRFTLRSSSKLIGQAFGLVNVPDLPARYNIAPGQLVAVVRQQPGRQHRELAFLRWGLIPPWANDPTIGDHMANARMETAATKPSFRNAYHCRRCLVLADGFYEWQRSDGRKKSFYVHRQDSRPFGMAGLWERWDKGEEPVETCTILTADADALMRPIHERMPVILEPEQYANWLDPRLHDDPKLAELLQPAPVNEMIAYRVSTLVNDPHHDVPACVEPRR